MALRLAVALLPLAAVPGSAFGTAVVELDSLVPNYMDGDLETAITPTPQQAELGAKAFVAGKVVVVRPDTYRAPDTLFEELKRLFGEELTTVTDSGNDSPEMPRR